MRAGIQLVQPMGHTRSLLLDVGFELGKARVLVLLSATNPLTGCWASDTQYKEAIGLLDQLPGMAGRTDRGRPNWIVQL